MCANSSWNLMSSILRDTFNNVIAGLRLPMTTGGRKGKSFKSVREEPPEVKKVMILPFPHYPLNPHLFQLLVSHENEFKYLM